MHIYFSAIGGAGISALAQVAYQAGHSVSGSDKQDTQYIHYLQSQGISNIHIGQGLDEIASIHDKNPIDWFVYSSAVSLENPHSPELQFCRDQSIKISKRDELLNELLQEKKLKLIAIAGTHGKSTTTAMTVWLLIQLKTPASYIVPAKTSFAELGHYDPKSKYFIYEADEFDRNFLAYEPALSLISGVSWDHHEIFPTRDEYQSAFRDFISQSAYTFIWQEDADYLQLKATNNTTVLDDTNKRITNITIVGMYNRLDAWLAIQAVHKVTQAPLEQLIKLVNHFPGLSRRMEQIIPNLYSDYAHTPEKVRGAMSVATEMAADSGQDVVVVYEPLTNRRQLHMLNDYKDCFNGASKVYWLPSYLAREDPTDRIVEPAELIAQLHDPALAQPMLRNAELKTTIQKHIAAGDMVVAMAGGGGNSLDDWLRTEFDV
jgi:UDP-N-acetylmuramate--alanine ligase